MAPVGFGRVLIVFLISCIADLILCIADYFYLVHSCIWLVEISGQVSLRLIYRKCSIGLLECSCKGRPFYSQNVLSLINEVK